MLRALRFIEAELTADVRLIDIARAAGLSRFQLSRSFAAATGMSAMHYLRARRLTEAARALARGAPDILEVALEFRYGSHEAFTRAFCCRFGVTPERVRRRGHLAGLPLTQALVTAEPRLVEIAPPAVRAGPPLLVAGLTERYTPESNAAIPMLWRSFVPRIGEVPHRRGGCTYGVHLEADGEGGFAYLAGVEVSRLAGCPPDFAGVRIPARRYAVFLHRGHISGIRATMYSIWCHYLPRSGLRHVEAADFERYTEAFDPRTGNGEVEIWIPVR